MIDKSQIPHLISLLDDESRLVREVAMEQLVSFGPCLREELKQFSGSLNTLQEHYLNYILRGQKRIVLRRQWIAWPAIEDCTLRLETALGCLSEYLSPVATEETLANQLDRLADEFRCLHPDGDALQLVSFLFQTKKFTGNEKDYYNPQNSNLHFVMSQHCGIPISLASVFILLGQRLQLDVSGCPFPGHFLARIRVNSQPLFVDCFSDGMTIKPEDMREVHKEDDVDLETVLQQTASPEEIVKRFLANLIRAYQILEDFDQTRFLVKLFKELESRAEESAFRELTPEMIIGRGQPLYRPGQIVSHQRYGYRGIIVDFDLECRASDAWYYANKVQPRKDQPWYHVLVDGSEQVTYVAESNLDVHTGSSDLNHPLISRFFSKENNGAYLRNGNPWPQTDF